MKVHCVDDSIWPIVDGQRVWRPLDDGSYFIQSLCGVGRRRIGGQHAFIEGGEVVSRTMFRWLPRRAQCGHCHRLFDPFRVESLFTRTPHGQRCAPEEHALAVEVALHGIAAVFG